MEIWDLLKNVQETVFELSWMHGAKHPHDILVSNNIDNIIKLYKGYVGFYNFTKVANFCN